MVMSVSKNTAKWIADVGIIAGISSLAIFCFPIFDALISSMSIHLVPRYKRLVMISIYAYNMLTYLMFGSILGAVTACAIRQCKIIIAIFPAVIVFCFYLAYGYFGTIKYRPVPPRSWFDVVDLFSWLILLIAAFGAAWFILWKRKRT